LTKELPGVWWLFFSGGILAHPTAEPVSKFFDRMEKRYHSRAADQAKTPRNGPATNGHAPSGPGRETTPEAVASDGPPALSRFDQLEKSPESPMRRATATTPDGAGGGPAPNPRAPGRPRARTRIQREKRDLILEAALEVFSREGFRGATIDQIAEAAGMSKPNLLYYFPRKEEIYKRLLAETLDVWLAPLREIDEGGDPIPELRSYIRRKLEMSRDFPRQSRLFANEMLQGAPRILEMLTTDLRALVDAKASILEGWMEAGKIVRTDPYHLIFSIWATTQHYADFDVQVRAVLGEARGGEGRFEDAARFLEQLFLYGLLPKRG
jgi:TetR/AcrR family transcriptional regulator